MQTKLREIIAPLLKAGSNREGGSGRKSKTTVLSPFLTSGQEDVFYVNHD